MTLPNALMARGATRRVPALAIACLALLSLGCLQARRQPFSPTRPWLRPDLGEVRPGRASEPFPERHLEEVLSADPPHALAHVEEIYRQIALLDGPEPDWRLAPVEAEIDSIRREVAGLGLGMGSLFRLRLGKPRPEELVIFRRAANLQIRWGLALMRTGSVDRRVWGAERLRAAMAWDPENPLPVLLLAGYQEIGGFWSDERDLLDAWLRDHGPNDIVELQRLRKRERVWKVEQDPEALREALQLGRQMAGRHGGYAAAPAWLSLEHARLLLHADSLRAAEAAASLALRIEAEPGADRPSAERDPASPVSADRATADRGSTDPSTAAQAELLLGVIQVRRLEYARADAHFQRAISLGAPDPSLAGLVSWLLVPWDLWTVEERAEFDRESDRSGWLAHWWRARDPILATPELQENRVEYLRRVGEAWFALEGIDLAMPGPLSDPGQVFLRYGRPDEWISTSGEAAFGTPIDPYNSYGVRRGWQFRYDFPGRPQPMFVAFQGDARGSRFAALDSLRGPSWPPWLFNYGFEGRSYRLNTAPATLRRPDGGLRLLLCQDTWMPEYSVRYPLQGFRFAGEARVHTAVYRLRDGAQALLREQETVLDRESVVPLEWTFRRRSGVQVVDLDEPGSLRLASQLVLRDTTDRIVAMTVENGRELRVEPVSEKELDASSLVLLAGLPDSVSDKREWEIAPGRLVHGPDLLRSGLVPRADHHILGGEDFAFYLEVYNLGGQRGVTDMEMEIVVEHLDTAGEMDFSVGVGGPTLALTRRGVTQWNIARALGLGNFEPGSYRLRIEVVDRKTAQRVVRTVEFGIDSARVMVNRYGWDRLALPGD
jgi:hypothetical protein